MSIDYTTDESYIYIKDLILVFLPSYSGLSMCLGKISNFLCFYNSFARMAKFQIVDK
jgi:hypothetical protein